MNIEALTRRLSGQSSRWLVAVVLLPPILYCALADNFWLFFGLVLIIGGLTWLEFSRLLFGPERLDLALLALAGWAAAAVGANYGPAGQSLGLVAALALGSAYALRALGRENGPVLLNLLGRFALGHLYISYLLSFALLLKKSEDGGIWIVYVLAVTAAADTAAYYVGRRLQGPKLWPKISPNKTISGLLGGVAAAVLVSALFSYALAPSFQALTLLGLFLALWGAFGDLFESTLKRALDIKDSSKLLLGHGGFWDRMDSLLFNFAPVYAALEFFLDPH